ncbi:isoprenoid biosynthesis glyoxalase ElbB [Pseudoalteromonas sp. SSDWG2]|uniref:isoprenoid biosynthesis glyoxalase ElbB n=1 Tax=Pseudoalteromonas sp. SSDWG2 TaxID=3139391 RepID=UPI003BA9BB28
MTKVAIILSGCGVFDGAEIHESVLTLLYLEQAGAQYQCFAPNVDQYHVINHLTGEEQAQKRNVLEEAARIARDEILDLKELNVDDYDALVLPGGFGAAKNLCDFALKGAHSTLNTDVERVCREFAQQTKPAAYLCIAPAIIAHIYPQGTKATIGHDADTAAAIEAIGAKHVECAVDDIVVDEQAKVISTPAYMLAGSVKEAAAGIEKAINKLVSLS